MSILSVGKIAPHPSNNGTKSAEISFDGRAIAVLTVAEEGPGKLEILEQANPKDIEEATAMAKGSDHPSLSAYANELFQVALAQDNALRRMRTKLRKNTLFANPGHKVQAIASPYCERIRFQIKQKYPEAVILNTLSEDEAFRHYQVQ